jgi:hypothetical protein
MILASYGSITENENTMPIKWKKSQRFNPQVVLDKIEDVRTVSADGGVSFSGMEIDDYLPTIESYLDFPAVTSGLDKSILVWKAVAKAGLPLNCESFLKSINAQLNSILAVKEQCYTLLTEISIECADIPKAIKIEGVEIKFWGNRFPSRYRKPRAKLLDENKVPIELTPDGYCKVSVSVRTKSPSSAFHIAMRALDIQRALWCLMTNPGMQITFGNSSPKPINSVRLGSRHTLHTSDGDGAIESIWYEPNFKETSVVGLADAKVVLNNSKFALRRMSSCSYGRQLLSSLIRYVRALDENDANTAFLRLWGGAVEALTTPGIADYDQLVKRCSFLYSDSLYHRQVLEHLREYRNANVHAGEESNHARIYCFQLQRYYRALFWFHVRNANFFKSLDEANLFLDSSESDGDLMRQIKIIRKALKFKS